jgi:hypothetical protein
MVKTFDEASSVNASEGAVIVDGPDGVAVTFTPDAALETSTRLSKAGKVAKKQGVRQTDASDE